MRILALFYLAVISAAAAEPAAPVRFSWFEYTGRDGVLSIPVAPVEYRNPIRAGFYPDPDICRVGDDYYSVNSSFAYFPGIPMFHSRDLVNWTQIGNVVDRPSQLNYDGLGVSRGIFAPSLSHHGDTYFLVCTFVDAGGNFVMTAKNPAGPWSDPVWLGFDGIDPSLFFDDGRAWVVNNGAPEGDKPLYSGHRAIWIQEFDPDAKRMIGPRQVIVDGGSDLAKHPVWVEGPHLFKREGWYYLICAEGGTAENHSEVVFRSRSVRGPYVSGPANPILTQRDLPTDRPNPITCTGHADFVQRPNGDWWALFLGCRPYKGALYNTGRETFMLPVTWTDGWPVILPQGKAVPYVCLSPSGAAPLDTNAVPFTGNFTWRDRFSGPSLSPLWLMLRQPHETWWRFGAAGSLYLTPRKVKLWETGNPTFIGRRLQHAHFSASTELAVPQAGVSAGLVAFQNETHHYFFGVRRRDAKVELFVEWLKGGHPEFPWKLNLSDMDHVQLRIEGNGDVLEFDYRVPGGQWTMLLVDKAATALSTEVAGGFVGATIGLHARLGPQ